MPRFNANLSFLFTERPWDERFDAAARAGFKSIELNPPAPFQYSPAQFAARLKDAGLQCVVMLPPFSEDPSEMLGLASLPGREAQFRTSIERALEYVRVADCRLLHVLAGAVAPGMDRAAAEARYADNLRVAAELARAAGATVCVEPVCRARVPEYLLKTTAQALEIIRRLEGSGVKLLYDTFHAQLEEGALSATLTAALPQLAHIQVSSPPSRQEPRAGTGEIDFDFLFEHIDRIGYQGWIAAEYHPSKDTLSSLAWARRWGIGG